MTLFTAVRKLGSDRRVWAGAAALTALAWANQVSARRAERRNPPYGRFLEVDGIRLHYSDRGSGPPVVLLHGNVVDGSDWDTSGVADVLLRSHRVIVFDRPGFGHSERRRQRSWSAAEQAALLHEALRRLGVERPVLVGHSWGAIVALALALRHPADVAGLVLISGYYVETMRPDVLLAAPGAVPILGDVLNHTVAPLLGKLMMPLLKRGMFSPAPIPRRFSARFSDAMALRPSQLRAASQDGVLMIPSVLAMRDHYGQLSMPVVILAGEGDKIVFRRNAEWLHDSIPASTLRIVEGAGHMLHYVAPKGIADIVRAGARLPALDAPARAAAQMA